jgi:hypothetical protein
MDCERKTWNISPGALSHLQTEISGLHGVAAARTLEKVQAAPHGEKKSFGAIV